jgi:hypothetical protein
MITKYHSGDQIEKHEMGGACSTYRERRGVYRVLVGKPDRNHLEDPGIDGRIILRWIFRRLDRGTDRIDLAREGDRWRARVGAVMNLRAPSMRGIFLTG